MDQRINSIYQLIDFNSKGVCDVGTDHGFLPVMLVSNGFKGKIIASDINHEPLRRAAANAKSYNVYDRITFCRCDGLPEHLSDSFDTAVIAGMGGDLICSIIDKADWIFSAGYSLILQPMTRPEVLRYYLINNGFTISEDNLAEGRNRLYQIIRCRFTSVNESYMDYELFSGKRNKCSEADLYFKLLEKYKRDFEIIIRGSVYSDDISKSLFYRKMLEQIISATA